MHALDAHKGSTYSGSAAARFRAVGNLTRYAPGWIKAILYFWLAYAALFVDIAPCHGQGCASGDYQYHVTCNDLEAENCYSRMSDCNDCSYAAYCSSHGGVKSRSCTCVVPPSTDSLSVSGTITYVACGVENWCRGGATLTLSATDGASPAHSVRISSSSESAFSFDCGWGTNPCYQNLPEGQGTVSYQAQCTGGLTTNPPGVDHWKLDLGAPFVSYSLSGGEPGSNGWYRTGEVQMNCSGSDGLSGLAGITYGRRIANGEGTFQLSCTASDKAGNTADAYAVVRIDGNPPVIAATLGGGTPGGGGWYRGGPVNLSCAATDVTSGVASVTYGRMSATDPGTTDLNCAAIDNAGNSSSYSTPVSIDGIPPSGEFLFAGKYCGGGWYNSPVLVSLQVSDGHSGPAGSSFSVDGAGWSSDKKVGDGIHTLSGMVNDVAGNSASVGTTLQVDTAPPASIWTTEDDIWIGGTATLEGKSTDLWSGIAKVEISLDSGVTWISVGKKSNWSYGWNTKDPEKPILDGSKTLLVRAKDNACNQEPIGRLKVNVDNTSPELSLQDSLILMGRSTAFIASDQGSGMASVRLTISGNGIEPRVEDFSPADGRTQFEWDGRDGNLEVAPFGVYEVLVEAWDKVGNHSSAQGNWVRPFPESPPPVETPINVPIDGGNPVASLPGYSASQPQAAASPRTIPFWSLALPLGALGVWLAASNIALARDKRWSELHGIRNVITSYRDRMSTFTIEEGEDD